MYTKHSMELEDNNKSRKNEKKEEKNIHNTHTHTLFSD